MESVNQFILYTGEDGDVKLKLFLEDETLWLPQKPIGDLFQVESHTINYHIKEIYKSGELDELSTTRKFRVVQREGNRDVARDVVFYNLDVIIAVGYRVNSKRATQFRIWATKVLKEYMIKGFAQYVPANEKFINRSPISLLNAVLTMIPAQKLQGNSMQRFKINSILLLQGKLLQRLFI